MNQLHQTETDTLKLISDWLSLMKIVHIRVNSGAYVGEHTNKQGIVKKRFVKFIRILFPRDDSLKFPDFQLIYKGVTVYIEVKRLGKHKDEPGQDAFLKIIIENGGYAAKIQSLEEMEDIIHDINMVSSKRRGYYEFNGYGL